MSTHLAARGDEHYEEIYSQGIIVDPAPHLPPEPGTTAGPAGRPALDRRHRK
jgi:hypothetical protein